MGFLRNASDIPTAGVQGRSSSEAKAKIIEIEIEIFTCNLQAELASKTRGNSGVTYFWGASSSRFGRRRKWWESWVQGERMQPNKCGVFDLTMIWDWKHSQIMWCEILWNVHVVFEPRLSIDYQMWSWYWNPRSIPQGYFDEDLSSQCSPASSS